MLGLPCGSAGKESACGGGYLGLIPVLGRSPGEGSGYPLQYCGLENSRDSTVHGVAKSVHHWATFTFTLCMAELLIFIYYNLPTCWILISSYFPGIPLFWGYIIVSEINKDFVPFLSLYVLLLSLVKYICGIVRTVLTILVLTVGIPRCWFLAWDLYLSCKGGSWLCYQSYLSRWSFIFHSLIYDYDELYW